jgi:hypothetical protein
MALEQAGQSLIEASSDRREQSNRKENQTRPVDSQ